jgi:GT2 family glycosyltransferase
MAGTSSNGRHPRAPLDVVVVSYRCRELLRACLDSLRAFPPSRGARIVVVDNGSADGTVELVCDEYPEVRLIALSRNIGFAAASNIGIREGRGEYVLALNPDTELTGGALDVLLSLMDADPRVGIAGCRLVLPNGRFDHAAKRAFPTPLSALGHFTWIGRRARARGPLAAYRAPDVEEGPVDAVNGAFMLLRRAALDEIGAFDEDYWMYMEDLDLCYRFAEASWTTWYEPRAAVLHVKHGSTGGRRTPRLELAFHAGMVRYYRKHNAQENSVTLNALVYAGIGTKLLLSLVSSTALCLWPAPRLMFAGGPPPRSEGINVSADCGRT